MNSTVRPAADNAAWKGETVGRTLLLGCCMPHACSVGEFHPNLFAIDSVHDILLLFLGSCCMFQSALSHIWFCPRIFTPKCFT